MEPKEKKPEHEVTEGSRRRGTRCIQGEVEPVKEQTSEHDGTHSGGAFGQEVERREVSGVKSAASLGHGGRAR